VLFILPQLKYFLQSLKHEIGLSTAVKRGRKEMVVVVVEPNTAIMPKRNPMYFFSLFFRLFVFKGAEPEARTAKNVSTQVFVFLNSHP
jgi:hypothetical protein